jgi:dehydrogenase/reductase SDR family member 7B
MLAPHLTAKNTAILTVPSFLCGMNEDRQIVWITGASAGIGEHLAYAYAAQGATLILSARRYSELERVKNNCPNPAKVHLVTLDLEDDASLLSAAQKVKELFGYVDVLVNNGGISQRSMALNTPVELDRRIMQINYMSHVILTKLVAPWMVERKQGTIVVITSLTGKWGFFLRSAYSASKHALHGFFESLRLELEPNNIQISLVTPGFIATDISKNAVDAAGNATGEMDPNQANGLHPKKCAEQILKGVHQKKLEFGVGKKELLGLYIRRFFPSFFHRLLRKQSAK